jgi:predicted 3-demethylubiquinone-9 3-methyltransferase (glyoxalase superfamily)
MIKSSKIKPFLWFDTEAEAAAKFYTSVFRNSKMGRVLRVLEGGGRIVPFKQADEVLPLHPFFPAFAKPTRM